MINKPREFSALSEIINDNTHKFGGKRAREALSKCNELLGKGE